MDYLLPAQINAFLAALQSERGRSSNTIAAYRNDLTQFSTYVSTQVQANSHTTFKVAPSETLDAALIDGWYRQLATQSYAPATVARKQAAVASFCQWLAANSFLDGAPSKSSVRLAPIVAAPTPLDAELVDRLLAHASSSRTPQSLRDHALLLFMIKMGCTVSQVVALNVLGFTAEDGKTQLRVGAKTRSLPKAVADATADYLEDGRAHLASVVDEDALFINHRGQRLTRQGLWLIVKRLASEVGIAVEVTPQILRQTFALHQIEEGITPNRFAEQMGTSSRRSAQDYRRMAKRAKSNSIVIDTENARRKP